MFDKDVSPRHSDGGGDIAPPCHEALEHASFETSDNLMPDPRDVGNLKWELYNAGNGVDASLLDDAIAATQLAVGSKLNLSNDAELLIDLGFRLGMRFLVKGNAADLDRAIPLFRRVLELALDKDAKRAGDLGPLGTILCRFFGRERAPVAFNCGILAVRCAVELTPDIHVDKPELLGNLGELFLGRFQCAGELDDIEQSVAACRRAVELTPDDHASKAARLSSLSDLFHMCFGRTANLDDLEQSIAALSQAVELTADDHTNKPALLGNLGLSFRSRFEHTDDLEDLERSITALHRALELTPNAHADKSARYNNLGNSFYMRFECTGELRDIEQAIAAHRRALELTPDPHADKPVYFTNLGNSLDSRFQRTGELDDIEESIAAHCRALELTPDDHARAPVRSNSLGVSFLSRFKHTGELDDLERSIAALGRAVELTSDDDANKPAFVGNLGLSFLSRFERRGQLEDIEQSIALHRRVLELTRDGHAKKPGYLDNLSGSLLSRFERTGKVDDIEQSIAALHRAVELTPDDYSSKSIYLTNLGHSYLRRFECTGKLDDIEQSIVVHCRALELTPVGHAHEPARSNGLGVSLRLRFEHNGELHDIEQSIAVLRRAVELSPDGHVDKPAFLDNVGNSFLRRFGRTGDLDDIEQSIAAHRRVLELTPDGHADKPGYLDNLGISFYIRFERTGELHDIEQSIALICKAVELTPDDHARKPAFLSNVGLSFESRFLRTGEYKDLEQCVAAARRALELTPDGHAHRARHFNNLGKSLLSHSEYSTDLGDIEQSVVAARRALQLTPDSHAERSVYLANLATSLAVLCEQRPTQSNFDAAMKACTVATTDPLLVPSSRLKSAVECVCLHANHTAFGTSESFLSAHSYVIAVLPEIVWLGHDIHRRFDESAKVGKLVNAAVFAATIAKSLKLAVEWIETGRALIWTQLLSLRTPLDDLSKAYPELAESLQNVQRQLQQSAPISFALDAKPFGNVPGMSVNPGADRHRQLTIHYEKLLKEIRVCAGFEGFLRPKQLESLVPPSDLMSGPLVFINVGEMGCHALVLSPVGQVVTIALPELPFDRSVELRRLWITHAIGANVRARSPLSAGKRKTKMSSLKCLLGHLWDWIVLPVLEALGFTNPVTGGNLPHITWCPTGPLMQLPLHAAGLYNKQDGPRVYDFAVSSYVPSLSALHRCCNGAQESGSTRDVLIVSQPATPNHAPLPGTEYEGARLETTLKAKGIRPVWLNDNVATVDGVHTAMKRSSWVHLACHGSQNRDDLTQSAFELFDGPLTLSALMSTASDHANVAFLSACQTAVGDENTPEESAHLAAGMLAVGFKGVVATMWSIQDADAPIVVEAFYQEMLALRSAEAVAKGSTGAAHALHEATRVLRREVGESSFMRWVPFVHFGV